MFNFKNITTLLCLVFLVNCGYSPLLNSERSFSINDLSFEGNRKVNNYISAKLKRYKDQGDDFKSYNIKVLSTYSKTISNKDDSGNPKNYKLLVKIDVNYSSDGEYNKIKILERSITLPAQAKKTTENELEKRYIKDLSNALAQDLIFLLRNQ